MSPQKVYITANPTPNPDAFKFIVDRQLVDGDPVTYFDVSQTEGSPLAKNIFELGGIKQLFAFQNFVTITKDEKQIWQEFARAIGRTIRETIQSGVVPLFAPAEEATEGASSEAIVLIKQVLDEVRPMVAMDGGNITFAGYQEGIVQLFMQGSCSGCPSSALTLKQGIESRLREVLPEIKGVVAI